MSYEQMEAQINKHIQAVYKILPLDKENRKIVADRLTQHAQSYIDDNPDATFEDVVNEIGTPQECADDYKADMSEEDINNGIKERKQRKLFRLLMCALVATLLVVALVIGMLLLKDRSSWTFKHEVSVYDMGYKCIYF